MLWNNQYRYSPISVLKRSQLLKALLILWQPYKLKFLLPYRCILDVYGVFIIPEGISAPCRGGSASDADLDVVRWIRKLEVQQCKATFR